MDYSNLTAEKKVELLESTVAYKSAKEVRELFEQLGGVEFTARALAYACRYKGTEHVKALVECGATFDYEQSDRIYDTYDCRNADFTLSLISFNSKSDKELYTEMIFTYDDLVFDDYLRLGKGEKLPVLPLTERLETVKYLCENGKGAGFDSGTLLYYSILTGNFKMADELKKSGAVLPDICKKTLSEGGSGGLGKTYWYEYSVAAGIISKKNLKKFFEYYHEELDGKPLHFTETIYAAISSRIFYIPDMFRFFLTCFNHSKMNKSSILKVIIKNNLIADLETAAEFGWLKQSRKRDEMIAFATENGVTEASAWLLDYKNRTADLAAEQEKAEKKMMRELNADPNSVSELKKIWSYKKREDGTLVITSYKGSKTEITVPAKIGKETVTAIGAYAFSPHAPRRTQEQANNRARIQKITLPDSVKVIEEGAFGWCKALKEINVPNGVTEICNFVFLQCNIKSLTLPDSVKSIGENAFSNCPSLEKINLPDGISQISRYAFIWCKALKEIEIPGSVEKISALAFFHCFALAKVIIHEGVAEIDREAFSGCKALKEIELPASISKIKNYKNKENPVLKPFDGIPDLTVTVTPKSYAEKYCKRNELNYKLK